MTVRVAHAAAQDVDAIMPVMESAFDSGFGEAWTAGQCRGVLTLPGSALHIAYRDDRIAGFALWRFVLDEAELLLLAIMPELQRSGIGTALLDRVIAEARQAGVLRLHVEVRSDNSALAYYSARQFEQIGIRPQYYRRTDDGPKHAVTLCRTL